MKTKKDLGRSEIRMPLKDYVDGKFYVLTGVYTAIAAFMTGFMYWNSNQLAERFERQLKSEIGVVSDRIAVVSDRIYNLEEKLDNVIEIYDAQLEEQRRKTDLLYKKLGLEE